MEKGKFGDIERSGHRKLKDVLKDIYLVFRNAVFCILVAGECVSPKCSQWLPSCPVYFTLCYSLRKDLLGII